MAIRIFKTRPFARWAENEGLTDWALVVAVAEMEAGLVDADLGGHVVKKRVALPGRGKRGSTRTLVAFQRRGRAFFLFGFAKNERDNVSGKELEALKRLAAIQLGLTQPQLQHALRERKLFEVQDDPSTA